MKGTHVVQSPIRFHASHCSGVIAPVPFVIAKTMLDDVVCTSRSAAGVAALGLPSLRAAAAMLAPSLPARHERRQCATIYTGLREHSPCEAQKAQFELSSKPMSGGPLAA